MSCVVVQAVLAQVSMGGRGIAAAADGWCAGVDAGGAFAAAWAGVDLAALVRAMVAVQVHRCEVFAGGAVHVSGKHSVLCLKCRFSVVITTVQVVRLDR